jgi:formylglycine-generating enzyme required for sulfatase activity
VRLSYTNEMFDLGAIVHKPWIFVIALVLAASGDGTRDVRVRRGGSRHTWAFYARSSFRSWNSPETRYTLLGMRLLREEPAN